ncbi:MAG: hypothetical protein IJB41_00175, partial [Clostridia bacterium]|nr:hypothetical protein [Clostridia bacterium]
RALPKEIIWGSAYICRQKKPTASFFLVAGSVFILIKKKAYFWRSGIGPLSPDKWFLWGGCGRGLSFSKGGQCPQTFAAAEPFDRIFKTQ